MRTHQFRILTIVVVTAILILACDLASLSGGSTKPTVVIQSPANGAQLHEGIVVQVVCAANDPSGIASVDLTVDGVTAQTDKPQSAQRAALFTPTLNWKPTAGEHTLGVRAYNAAGVASDLVSVTVSVAPARALVPTLAEAVTPSPPAAGAILPTAAAATRSPSAVGAPTPTVGVLPTVAFPTPETPLPPYAQVVTENGWNLIDQERYDEAVGEFAAAIEADPQYADAYVGRGYAY